MQIPAGTFCPLLKKECIGLKCVWCIKLAGTDNNTGKDVDEWMCAMVALPMLLCENSAVNRQTGAAVESLRNRVAEGNEVLAAGVAMQLRLRDGH